MAKEDWRGRKAMEGEGRGAEGGVGEERSVRCVDRGARVI